jgi:hypothetical protein
MIVGAYRLHLYCDKCEAFCGIEDRETFREAASVAKRQGWVVRRGRKAGDLVLCRGCAGSTSSGTGGAE